MKRQKILGLLLIAVILVSGVELRFPKTSYAVSDDDYASSQIAVTEPNEPHPDSAYILFQENPEMRGMTYYQPNGAGRYDELYSEPVTWKGVEAVQVYVQNYFYLKINDDYADANDQIFSLTIDYWDYGGGGYYYVDYIPKGSQDVKTERVYKLGLDENNVKTEGTWFRVTMYLDDAEFTGKFPNGADIRIRSGAYNSFSKIEVRNISRSAQPGENFGTFNKGKAESLHKLGAFQGFGEGETFEPQLERELTREEALTLLVQCYGLEEEVKDSSARSGFSDVSPEADPYVAKALELGVIEKGDKLGAKESVSQKELVLWYLRLLGVQDETMEENAYALAKQYRLITTGSMLFQPEKKANVDALVALAMNIFAMPNLKTGYNPFSSGFDAGKYTMDTLTQTNDENLWNWLMSTPFQLPKKEHIDAYTGRTYYTVNFFWTAGN